MKTAKDEEEEVEGRKEAVQYHEQAVVCFLLCLSKILQLPSALEYARYRRWRKGA